MTKKKGIRLVLIALAMTAIAPLCTHAASEAALTAPKKLKVKRAGERALTVSWNAVKGAEGYLISVKNLETGTSSNKKLKETKQKGEVKVDFKKLNYATKYRFSIRAYAGKKKGPQSTMDGSTKLTTPGNVKLKVSKKTATAVALSWSASKNATGYAVIEIRNGKSKVLSKTKNRTATIRNLPGGTYTFAVKPFRSKGGKTAYGKQASVKATVTGDIEKYKRLAATIDDGNVYDGGGNPYRRYSVEQVEAYANYANNGRAFGSRTKRLVWINRRSYRLFVFQWIGKTWKLEHDWPCIIGMSSNKTMGGVYILSRLSQYHQYGYNYAKWLTSFAGANAIHSLLYPGQSDYLTAGYQASLGCVRVVSSAAKFIYENCTGATCIIR